MRKIDLREERLFENKKQLNKNIRQIQSKFYWAVEIPSKQHDLITFEKIKNKKLLEVGCSDGLAATKYSKYFYTYLGIDISDKAINKAKSLKLKNAEFICTDAHLLPMEKETFDCVIVNSLLHHLDLEKSLSEIYRVLKKDGYLIFREPLGTNPFFQLYRFLTPTARTSEEKPFDFNDIKIMKSYFHLKNIQYFGFLNIFSAYLRSKFLRKILSLIDYYLSKTFLKFFFWQFSGFIKKR